MSLLKELINLNKKPIVEQDDPWDRGYLDGVKGRAPYNETLAKDKYPNNKEHQEDYLDGVKHGIGDRKAKSGVNEMDFAFGGAQAQPMTTDGPMPPEGDEADAEYGDYADYEKDDDGEGSTLEGEDHLALEIPFFIRMLEWAREECNSDEEIHKLVENLLALDKSPLTMDDYDTALEGISQDDDMEGGEFDDGGEGGEFDDGGEFDEVEAGMGENTAANKPANGNGGVFRMG